MIFSGKKEPSRAESDILNKENRDGLASGIMPKTNKRLKYKTQTVLLPGKTST